MACPFPHTPTDSQLTTPARASSSSSPSPLSTPGFQPNVEAPMLASEEVSIPALLQNVASSSPTIPSKEKLSDVDDITLDPSLDLSKPISTLLREGTMRAHTHAENSAGAAALISGKLALEEYITWLAILWRVYDTLELALAGHSPNPILAPTYDPAVLARSNALAKDITHLLSLLPPSSDRPKRPTDKKAPSGPLPPFALPPFLEDLWIETPPPLEAYISHIKSLSSSSSSAPSLLAHAYVRYLGDLSGGQVIGARVKKAYVLKGNEGTAFYEFEIGNSADEEEGKDKRKKRMTELKEWYRRGMDEGVGDDQELKAHLIKEANLAFALNTHLFTLIPSPSPSETDGAVAIREGQTSVAVQRPQRELRYYERRELEWREKERLRIERDGPDNSWRQLVERFAFFALAALLGWGIANYGEPILGPRVRELWRRLEPLVKELTGKKRGNKRF